LFDFSRVENRDFVVDFLLKSDNNLLRETFDKAGLTLNNVLRIGITEKDFEPQYLKKIILNNLVSNVSKRQVSIITPLLEQVIVPNLVIDDFATEIARRNAQNSVKPYEVTFQKGDKILFEGEPVTILKRDALRQAGYNVYELNRAGLAAMFVVVFIAALLFLSYIKFFEKRFYTADYMAIPAILSIMLAITAVLLLTGFSPYILPIPAYIMILAIFTNVRLALVAAIIMICVMTLGFQYDVRFMVIFVLLTFVCAMAVSRMRFSERFELTKTGFYISLAGLVLVLSVYLLEKCLIDTSDIMLLKNSVYIILNGVLSSFAAFMALPVFEKMFKIVTPYSLDELSKSTQPLLEELQLKAPGTYHHSQRVAILAEAAAKAINANSVLARVGALYHDIGKIERPLFFVENQSFFKMNNPHSKLTPKLSKMIILAHTKDGVEIAKKAGLPSIVQDFIIQHHGDSLAGYFYHKAVQEEGAENVQEEQFRYTGPRPNTKEAVILMIADAVESAMKSIEDENPSQEDIDALIDKIIAERLHDSQFSDSPITLKDIKTTAATFSRILRGMQHNRVKYAENLDEELANKIKQLEDKSET
ncbi:MAG: HDIG domain-containing protein, partial [Heliobacteriaceae bacterium]|nr:HDIG domain-containing protein [Heliobacteriaceae bacterium]